MITGIKQSISDQSGNFGFQFGLSVSDLTKPVNVGFSGVSGLNINWNLYQGKIYDNHSYYGGSYLANSNVFISGNIGKTSYDYYINGEVTALSQAKNVGTLNCFYINTESGNSIFYNNQIVGNYPSYNLSTGINFYTGQLASGTIVNNSNGNFQIFSGSSTNSNIFYSGNTTGNIAPGQTGYFYNFVSGAQVGSTTTGLYTLYTNFGNITENINFNAIPPLTSGYTVFNYSPVGNISGTPAITGSDAINISLNTISGFNFINTPYLNVTLSYVSGFTGNYFSPYDIFGNFSTLGSGFISGSGYISGFTSGIASGSSPVNGSIYSGYVSGYISNFVTGSGFTSGIVTGILSGVINPLLYNRSFTGAWDLSTGISPNNFTDFYLSGYYGISGNLYSNPFGPLSNFSGNSLYVGVSYIPYFDNLVDVALLTITGLNSGIQIQITGQRT